MAHASRIMTLEPGDRVEITIEGIGTLENVVVAEEWLRGQDSNLQPPG